MESQDSLAESRLRHQLELQARQINRVFASHHVPATIAGGSVRSKMVSFDIQSQISAGLERVRGLKQDLITALGVKTVALNGEQGNWRLELAQDSDAPVPLLPLLAAHGEVGPTTAVIGMSDGGNPVMLRFDRGRVKHVLVAGQEGAGKTTLLRTVAASLAFGNRQSDLQLLLMDSQDSTFSAGGAADHPFSNLRYLPHLLAEPIVTQDDATAWLRFLAEEVSYRAERNVRTPVIVALVDNIVSLLEAGGPETQADLLRILKRGPAAGTHVVAAVERADSPYLDARMRSMLSVRIVGRMAVSDEVIQRIAGRELPDAKFLYGGGDFLGLTGDECTYFQAAYLSDYDLHLKLSEIYGHRRGRLLALPYNPRPQMSVDSAGDETSQDFTVSEGGAVVVRPSVSVAGRLVDGDDV